MLRSRANALLSVRRVTEVNAGRKTAGIDGKTALLTPRRPSWPTGCNTGPPVETPACQAGVHPEGEREATPARNSRYRGPALQALSSVPGTRVGGMVRTEVLRISARPRLP